MESAALIELCCLSVGQRPSASHQTPSAQEDENTLSIAALLIVWLARALSFHSAGEPSYQTHVTLQSNLKSVKTQPREHSSA